MINQNITDVLKDNYMPYSAYVILERALPEIDGLKPSQRRILYTMHKMGLQGGNRKKSQGVVGQTMFLHPHGDMAIYETLVRMSKDSEALLNPYIDSKGNFGKQYSRDMKYASARYTEVRLSDISKEFFSDINKNTVDMIDNYDSTLKEPRLLPVTYPSILTNPQSGTAVGMSSSIVSFNISEVIDATIGYIKNRNSFDVSDYIKAPDLPTGGNIIYDKNKIDEIINTGRGSFDIRAKYRIEGNSIYFDELPYTTTFEAVIDKIAKLVKSGKIKDVVDVEDMYGINSKGIEVVVKGTSDKEVVAEKLFQMTPLQSSFSCNFNIICNDGKPRVLGVKDIIHEWLLFRVKSIKRGIKFDMDKKIKKRKMLLALKKILLDIDKAIEIIRNTKKNDEVIKNLMDSFDIDEEQGEFVAEIKLRHLNKEYIIQRTDDVKSLEDEIESLNRLLNDKKTLAKHLIKELQDIKKKYNQERKSEIIEPSSILDVEAEEIHIDDYNVRVFITKDGYLKKIPLTSLRGNFDIKVKDGDKVVDEIDTTNNSDVLVFTDKQNVYKYKLYDIENSKPSLLGEYLPTMLGVKDENILFTTVTNDYSGYLLIGFEDGKVAKIDLSAYETKQNRSMLKNAYANKKALYFNHIHSDMYLLAVSSIDKALIYDTSKINSKTSKTTIGNTVMKSKNDSIVRLYREVQKDAREFNYYFVSSAGVGKYLKDGDF